MAGVDVASPWMAAVATPHLCSRWKARRLRNRRSVFTNEHTLPTPQSTPSIGFPDQGQRFGGPAPARKAAAPDPLPRSSPSKRNLRSGRRHSQDDPKLPATTSTQLSPGLDTSTHPMEGLSCPPFHSSSRHGVAGEQARYDHAWHVVTSRIALPSSVAAEDSFGALPPESQLQSQDAATEAEFRAALDIVFKPKEHVPLAVHTQDIDTWHILQCRRHFGQHVRPMLNACANAPSTKRSSGETEDLMRVLQNSIQTTEAAYRLYSYGYTLLHGGQKRKRGWTDIDRKKAFRFHDENHTLVEAAISPELMSTLGTVLTRLIGVILGVRLQGESPESPSDDSWLSAGNLFTARAHLPSDEAEKGVVAKCRTVLNSLVQSLKSIGLTGERFENLFADIMDEMMEKYILQTCAGRWQASRVEMPTKSRKHPPRVHTAPSSCVLSLHDWVEDHFALLAAKVLDMIHDGKQAEVSFQRLQTWQRVALNRVATLRISELFDVVQAWPASRGGLDDLRVSVGTAPKRAQLVKHFAASLERNLLNPGRSTLEILKAYIAIIRAFHYLDHTNVLLNRAVGPLQLYLCRRDDAVRIVVGGLLSSPQDALKSPPGGEAGVYKGEGDKLVELAVILHDPSHQRRRYVEDGEQDWNDMHWVPDPIDAGVNYRRPKSEDVIGTLINALGSKDVFIKEFQVIVAERLLSSQSDFSRENKVLNLLKKRFGDSALQNCDVMIRDIIESRRIDNAIHRIPTSPVLGSPQPVHTDVDDRIHARILSRLYWPDLAKEGFLLPSPVVNAQKQYERSFEELKAGRKLAWVDHLGQATVQLELADRFVNLECTTVEAAVIYAFQDPDETSAPSDSRAKPVTRFVEELEAMLRMDPDLIRPALEFWVDRGVLRQLDNDNFVVIEDQTTTFASALAAEAKTKAFSSSPTKAASPAPPPAAPAKPALSAKEKTQRTVYWQFIVGMLTNSAASMPIAQMSMMLKMMIPDFTWNGEQLGAFLGEKVEEGVVEVVGGKYKLVKK